MSKYLDRNTDLGVLAAVDAGQRRKDVAEMFGISISTVSDIVARERAGVPRTRPSVARLLTVAPEYIGIDSNGHLEVLCWCESAVVMVDPATLRDGLTGSCGAPGCARP